MSPTVRTSGKAVSTLFAGLLSVACGILAVASRYDFFLVGVVVFWLLAFVLGVWSWIEIKRSSGGLRGKGLAGWGMGAPVAGFALGFFLMPVT